MSPFVFSVDLLYLCRARYDVFGCRHGHHAGHSDNWEIVDLLAHSFACEYRISCGTCRVPFFISLFPFASTQGQQVEERVNRDRMIT